MLKVGRALRTQSIRLVCFDLGGVLVRTCRSWQEACATAGVPVRRGSTSESATRARRELIQLFGTGKISERKWAERLADALSGSYSVEELLRVHHAWSRREYAGGLELIDALHGAGVDTACLSNTNHTHWCRLVHHDGQLPLSGAPEYPVVLGLRFRFASHIVGAAKPDVAFYRAMEQTTGTSGKRILFFDDLAENVQAARELGWNAEQIDPARETVPQLRAFLGDYDVL